MQEDIALLLVDQPAHGDTITIGEHRFQFVTSRWAKRSHAILIGKTLEDTCVNANTVLARYVPNRCSVQA